MKTVDRSLARAIAWKRLFTGGLSLCAGAGWIGILVQRGAALTPLSALALVIFFAGGVWTLRDGLRLHRLLAGPRG